MELFFRFTDNPQNDLERGYSYHQGAEDFLKSSIADKISEIEELNERRSERGLPSFAYEEEEIRFELMEEYNIVRLPNGLAMRLSGLCGWAIESTEEAEKEINEKGLTIFGLSFEKDPCAIFEGEETGEELPDGVIFTPKRIVKTFNI